MKIDTFYFGTHKLIIHHNGTLIPHTLHTLFALPLLPTIQITNIYVEEAEEFNVDSSVYPLVYASEEMNVYSNNLDEIRIYGESEGRKGLGHIKSSYNNNQVCVQLHNAFHTYWHNYSFQILNYTFIERLLLNTNAMILHSCFIEYQGQAILFTAPSGTGKTTQGKLWEKYESAHIVNGDRCLIQKYNNSFWACGYYLHGSAAECENKLLPIKAIVIVRQSSDDYIEEPNFINKLQWIYSETTVNKWNKDQVNKTIDLISELVLQTNVIIQRCTMNKTALHTLKHYLFDEEQEE